jgi:type I restriction enzyme S subunit
MTEIKDIPKGWKEKSLGEVFTIERGGSPRPIEDFITNDEDGINWIKIGDTKDIVKYIERTKEKIKPEGAKRSRMVYVDDFLLSNSMSFGRPYIMKTTGCIHDGWLVIRKNEEVDNNYLYYILSSSYLYQQFSNLAKGSTVKNLNIEAVKQAIIKFPPLPEQQAIVAKIEELLSELENGKQQLQTAQQQLKVYRQSLLRWAFEGKLTNKNVKDGELLKEWKVEKIGGVLKTIDGDRGPNYPKKNEFFNDGYCLFLSTKNVRIDRFLFEENIFITKEKDEKLRSGKLQLNDVIITTRGTLGNVALYDETIPYKNIRINSGMLILRITDMKLNNYYLMKFITSPNFINQLKNKQSGTAQPQIPANVLREIEIPVPPIKEQQLIVDELESKLTICDKIEETINQSLQQAETLRQSILKKAFEGKLV